MTRKEDTTEDGKKAIMYFVNNDLNVSEIISELSALGCGEEELHKAYKTLTQEDYKIYAYENHDTGDGLFVTDETAMKDVPPLTLLMAMMGSSLLGLHAPEAIDHAKKFLEVVKKTARRYRTMHIRIKPATSLVDAAGFSIQKI